MKYGILLVANTIWYNYSREYADNKYNCYTHMTI